MPIQILKEQMEFGGLEEEFKACVCAKSKFIFSFHPYLRNRISIEGEPETAFFPLMDAVFDAVIYYPDPLLELK